MNELNARLVGNLFQSKWRKSEMWPIEGQDSKLSYELMWPLTGTSPQSQPVTASVVCQTGGCYLVGDFKISLVSWDQQFLLTWKKKWIIGIWIYCIFIYYIYVVYMVFYKIWYVWLLYLVADPLELCLGKETTLVSHIFISLHNLCSPVQTHPNA